MKNILLLFFLTILFSAPRLHAQTVASSPANKTSFSNPLNVQLGDPYVLHTHGMYYMYGTGGVANKGFAAYSSTDLVDWKSEGQVYFHDNPNGWSDPNASW